MKFENLNIGFDAKRAVCNHTGIGNYSRYLIGAMAEKLSKNKYILYSPKAKDNPELQPILELDNTSLIVPGKLGRTFSSFWRSLEVTRRLIEDNIDVYHGLSNELPINIGRSGITSVVTIHDLIWRRIPQNYSYLDRQIYDFKYGESIRNATRIIAISQRTKADIVNDFGVDPDKIDVIYQGCNPIFGQRIDIDAKQTAAEKYGLPETYMLAVGTVEYRKNQMLAVKALRALPSEVKLVIVGRPHKSYYKEIMGYISKHGLTDRVMWLKNVPTSDLPAIYALARLTAYPSRYEGFGLPIVESLSAKTPVIAATGSCLEEAGGKGAIYVDPDNAEEFADAAKKIIEDNYLYHKLADNGAAYVRRFNTADFVLATASSYIKAIMD